MGWRTSADICEAVHRAEGLLACRTGQHRDCKRKQPSPRAAAADARNLQSPTSNLGKLRSLVRRHELEFAMSTAAMAVVVHQDGWA